MGTAKLQKRLMIISRRLPASAQRRGLTSFHISFITVRGFGLERKAATPTVGDLATPPEEASAAFMSMLGTDEW
jgi:hypothetical protein